MSPIQKISNGPRTGKGHFKFQSQRRPMPKKVHNCTTVQLCSFHMLIRLHLKSFKLGRLQQYEPRTSRLQIGFRKGRGIGNQINICWIIKKARELQKNIYFCFDYTKAFDCVDHNKLWKILKEMGIADNLSFLPRNHLYSGQETTVRMIHGTMG